MKVTATGFDGLYVLTPEVYGDDRGYFMESWSERKVPDEVGQFHWVQDNEAMSSQYVMRGMHYQLPPYAQTKLVRVIKGKVLDVVVDIRPQSTTYGQTFSIELSGENKKQLLVPKGFAHGYLTLSDEAIFAYKCDAYYHQAAESGIDFRSIDVEWPVDASKMIISDKDKAQPVLGKHKIFGNG